VRRRISWHLQDRTAVAMSDGDALPTKFQWRDLPRPKDEIQPIPQAGVVRFRDFKPDEHRVQLMWDGMQTDTFLNEVQLKQFIIRFVYMLSNDELIPSELLADANLVYDTGDWVDVFGCRDVNDEIIECPREIYRPNDRKIRFADRLVPRRQNNAKPRIHAKVTPRHSSIYTAPAEIPDEKCFFTFRAGGYYEKEQNPLENACQKGEKAV
jgi:hypothetical protein